MYFLNLLLHYLDDPLSKFTVGLQFHPERMLSEYEGNYAVYRNFVKSAKEKAIEMKLKEKHVSFKQIFNSSIMILIMDRNILMKRNILR